MENTAVTTEPAGKKTETWVRLGMRCKIQLALAKDDAVPKGFKTELIQEGHKVGLVPCTVKRFCPDRCHAEVSLDDPRFSVMTVECRDLSPFGEA